MQTDWIILSDYCEKCHIEPSFVLLLEEGGLITVQSIEGKRSFPASQLRELEQYTRMYYDLSINMEGIDAIHHLLGRIAALQSEIRYLKSRLRRFESDLDF